MASIFISYSSQSRELVKTLAKDFELAGHKVWLDQELTGGQSWWDQILSHIRDCDVFVFALTPKSLESHACKLECGYAQALGKPILPVMLEEGISSNLLPPMLTTIQFVDYRSPDRQAAFALVRALNDVPPPKPLPDPLPEPPPVPISYLSNLREQIDSTEALTFQEQSALFLRLKQGIQEGDSVDDVRSLLTRLRKRDDLFAKVAGEIDELLAAAPRQPAMAAAAANPAPAQARSAAADPAPLTPPPAVEQPMRVVPAPDAAAGSLRDRINTYQAAPTAKPGDKPWSTGWMIGLVIGTFIFPIVGIVAGIVGMQSPAKKSQGQGLLILGIIMIAVNYFLLF